MTGACSIRRGLLPLLLVGFLIIAASVLGHWEHGRHKQQPRSLLLSPPRPGPPPSTMTFAGRINARHRRSSAVAPRLPSRYRLRPHRFYERRWERAPERREVPSSRPCSSQAGHLCHSIDALDKLPRAVAPTDDSIDGRLQKLYIIDFSPPRSTMDSVLVSHPKLGAHSMGRPWPASPHMKAHPCRTYVSEPPWKQKSRPHLLCLHLKGNALLQSPFWDNQLWLGTLWVRTAVASTLAQSPKGRSPSQAAKTTPPSTNSIPGTASGISLISPLVMHTDGLQSTTLWQHGVLALFSSPPAAFNYGEIWRTSGGIRAH